MCLFVKKGLFCIITVLLIIDYILEPNFETMGEDSVISNMTCFCIVGIEVIFYFVFLTASNRKKLNGRLKKRLKRLDLRFPNGICYYFRSYRMFCETAMYSFNY